MRPELSHDEAFAELDAVAFDLLDGVERDAIMSHVASCAACRAELDALQETAADLAFAAPAAADATVASRGAIRERLMARAASEAPPRKPINTPLVFPRPIAPPPQENLSVRRRLQMLAIAASIVCVVSLGLFAAAFYNRQTVVDALKSQLALTDKTRRAADSLSTELAARDSLIAGIAGRDVTMMTLTSKAAKDPYARMFWDRVRHSWTMIAHNMPELKNGRTYQLWLVTPKAKISAGTFVARNGDAVVRATYDLNDPLTAIAVTDEPAGGVPQPTGSVIIAAQTQSR